MFAAMKHYSVIYANVSMHFMIRFVYFYVFSRYITIALKIALYAMQLLLASSSDDYFLQIFAMCVKSERASVIINHRVTNYLPAKSIASDKFELITQLDSFERQDDRPLATRVWNTCPYEGIGHHTTHQRLRANVLLFFVWLFVFFIFCNDNIFPVCPSPLQ